MYLVIDIGGTKTLIALFSKRGRVRRRYKFKTPQDKIQFLNELSRNLQDFLKYDIRALAVAVPGHVRIEQKNCSTNLGNRDWGWFNLSDTLNKLFSCPIYYENDANLASVYESKGIPGKTVFLTFSTGIGGGVARDGKLLVNDTDGFEPGHKKYSYNGETKEWEDIAAASALEKAFGIKYATDLRGKEIMQDVATRIYLGLPDIIKEYRPNTIILGGPLGKIFRLYAKYLPKIPKVKFRRPKRPTESVIYGGYLYAKQKERE